MPTEQEKADLSIKRGQLAANIEDPAEKKKFISAQGEADKAGGKDADYVGLVQKTNQEQLSQAIKGQYSVPRAERAKDQ